MKESSIKFSLSTLALLGLASVAAAPALADSAKISGNSHLQPTSEIQTNELKEQDLPFFARFLEGQKQEATDRKVALTGDATPLIKPKRPGETGGIITTKKYPSDAEDNSGGGIVTTQKYPSDSEDNSGGGIITTKKYPSDAEDNSGGHRPPHHRR